MSHRNFDEFTQHYRPLIDLALQEHLQLSTSPFSAFDTQPHTQRLVDAMSYSALQGGKRIRPLLLIGAAHAVNPTIADEPLLQCAASVEMIHAYSLIHDDLPSMDNDDLRRGLPTCHKKFDEASAILAGDALQTRAFEILTSIASLTDKQRLDLIKTLASASGATGMVGGQAIDLFSVNQHIDPQTLESMHSLKTGALIRAAAVMGGVCANGSPAQLNALDTYAQAIGLAFQVQDDILDIESDTHTLGKTQGSDKALNKPTYPAILGMSEAKAKAQQLINSALMAIEPFAEQGQILQAIAHYVIQRNR